MEIAYLRMSDKIETEELRLPVPWGFIAAKAWGSPQNSPVLVVHGMMDNAGSFNRLIPLLPKRFYYVCIDFPGHGLSSHFQVGVPLDFLNYVLSIELAIKALGWKDFIYLSHSLGGIIGSFYVSIYPGRVKKMIAIDLDLPIDYSGDKLVSRVQEVQKDALENYNNLEKLNSYDDVIYALKYKRMFCLNTEAAEAMFERAVTKVGESYKYNRDPRMRRGLRPLLNFEQYSVFFKKINIPLLYILTSVHTDLKSPKIGAMKKGLDVLKKINSIEFVIVEGNHDVHNNNPERVAPIIKKFLDANIPSKL
ncbi:serine hydrolase-like protein 2 isoform X4 [Belonocnema kinseyi]|uniref:serine hydrolase-like protein 2 isoform X4 n=1 Tax=Belonocnema kinseyi TaxID=2817044 RepID=UPI00143E0C2A|nr:serine hydrolase-like protein 2 isoform X4 [Belonocnema kinseyi]XP_033224647.1 serine hydrolase-like protein 2 isoform X4 [Belonocnema kinseyi]